MKKTYWQPYIQVTSIKPATIIAGSTLDPSENKPEVETTIIAGGLDGEFSSRRNSIWGDEEEE